MGNGESRVNLVGGEKGNALILGQSQCGRSLLITKPDKDVCGVHRQECQWRWKLEVWKKTSEDKALQVVIRHDWHPQKTLDSNLKLTEDPWTSHHHWDVIQVDKEFISPLQFRNAATGKYLALQNGKPCLSTEPRCIQLLPAGTAPSPGQTVAWGVGVPLAIFVVAGAGLVAGAGVAGAEALACLPLGLGAYTVGTVAGVATFAGELVALVKYTSENHGKVFVDKC